MRHPRGVVLAGALGALGLMTVLSALFGWAAPNLISRRLTQNAATVLFFFFGLRSLWQAFTTEDSMSSELAEVEAELDGDGKKPSEKTQGVKDNPKRGNLALQYLSPVLIEIATIGLAAQESVTGVALGGILGHAICTTAAVLGGKHLATQISEKAVSLCGGVLFLIFGVHSLLSGVEES
ncbi:hypothetical protein AXG93_1480s1000 [Marchantia polymorpha subsp. ruderalis]|uniref:GDT1 family protein n=1 Tax=Marchantia polymorpha subsp. ruderalis TaxID=1480154 RepID=A0A176W1J8_MARPO|nr:hypothetical protein AXG93_1480s1000 [Marchantia polymorpha subsp. ruderalis]